MAPSLSYQVYIRLRLLFVGDVDFQNRVGATTVRFFLMPTHHSSLHLHGLRFSLWLQES